MTIPSPRAGVASRPGAAPATAALRRVRGPAAFFATSLAIAAVVEVALWAILAATNHRTFGYVTDQHELLGAVVAVSCAIVGAIVIRQQPTHALGWLLVAEAQLQSLSGLFTEYGSRQPPLPATGAATWLGNYMWLPGLALAAGLLTPLFPDGRPASRRWRPLIWAAAAGIALASVAFAFIATAADPAPLPATLAKVGLVSALACGIVGAVGLAARMLRSTGAQRRRIGWLFTAFAISVVAQLLPVSPIVPTVAAGFVPIAFGVAMLRHHLFDGDRLLNRTLVYAVLTLTIVGVFGLSVGLASNALGGRGTGAVLAAVAIALGIAPARTAVQRVVDRLLYGARRDPYAALTDLGRQLSTAIAPDTILPIIVQTVTRGLRLPYAAVTLDGEVVPAATAGTANGGMIDIALRHAGAPAGVLTIGLPDGARFLDPDDERLLADFAQQIGAAAGGRGTTSPSPATRSGTASAVTCTTASAPRWPASRSGSARPDDR